MNNRWYSHISSHFGVCTSASAGPFSFLWLFLAPGTTKGQQCIVYNPCNCFVIAHFPRGDHLLTLTGRYLESSKHLHEEAVLPKSLAYMLVLLAHSSTSFQPMAVGTFGCSITQLICFSELFERQSQYADHCALSRSRRHLPSRRAYIDQGCCGTRYLCDRNTDRAEGV